MENCIFCKISKGEMPCYKIWENEDCIAFLDIAPAVEGMTVIIPKEHHTSYLPKVGDSVLCELIKAAKEVSKILDKKLDNVVKTKIVFEGLDVDHIHAKLYPMYRGKPHHFEAGEMASEKELENIAKLLTS